MVDTKYFAAAVKLKALGYEWKCDEWLKKEEETKYGCHLDLEPGMCPDGCVLDDGSSDKCMCADRLLREGKGREDCVYWKPIKFVNGKFLGVV